MVLLNTNFILTKSLPRHHQPHTLPDDLHCRLAKAVGEGGTARKPKECAGLRAIELAASLISTASRGRCSPRFVCAFSSCPRHPRRPPKGSWRRSQCRPLCSGKARWAASSQMASDRPFAAHASALRQRASYHSCDRIAPSMPEIKHLTCFRPGENLTYLLVGKKRTTSSPRKQIGARKTPFVAQPFGCRERRSCGRFNPHPALPPEGCGPSEHLMVTDCHERVYEFSNRRCNELRRGGHRKSIGDGPIVETYVVDGDRVLQAMYQLRQHAWRSRRLDQNANGRIT